MPVAYLLGGVPFGLLIAKRQGIDIRKVGSGNIGATNVGRELGKRYFFIVLLLDGLKAMVPAVVASIVIHSQLTPAERSPLTYALWVGLPIAAMLGHMFSPFLGFKGGKGVACGLGLVLGVWPYLSWPGLVTLAVFVMVYKLSGYISLGSIIGAIVLPLAYVAFALALGWDLLGRQVPVLVLITLIGAMIVVRHRTNIVRLIKGTELKSKTAARCETEPTPARET